MARHIAYRNLHERNRVRYSVGFKGRKVASCGVVLLHRARMKHANPAQLQRVRSRCREVCQWISGEWKETGEGLPIDPSAWHPLACDPKRFDGFRDASTGARVDSAEWVLMTADGCFYLNQEGG